MSAPTVTIHRKAEADAVAEIQRKATEPHLLDVDMGERGATKLLIAPSGAQVTDLRALLEPNLPAPPRRKGTAKLGTVDAFIAHAKRFASEHSVIFANPDAAGGPQLVSVLDYHQKGHDGAPSWGQHRGLYAFPVSDEWTEWTKNDAEKMSQSAFAAFVEDRITDIGDPALVDDTSALLALLSLLNTTFASPSKLLDLSRGLAVRENNRVVNATNLSTGEASLVYEAKLEGEDGAPLKVPGAFLVSIPVFKGEAPYRFAARLRFRTSGGNIVWWYELYNAQATFDDAFNGACAKAAKETGLPLFIGTPE